MGGHRHHDAGHCLGVHEAGWQHGELVPRHRVGYGDADELASLELADPLDAALQQLQLVRRLRADDPCLAVHFRLHVGGVGVDPHVGDAEHRLGAQRTRREHHVALPELDDRELLDLGLLVSHGVVLTHRVAAAGAPAHGVAALGDEAPLPQLLELPLYELAVHGVHGGELATPVHAVPDALHPMLDLLGEVHRHADGVLQLWEPLLGDVVYVEERLEELGVSLLEPLHHGEEWCPGVVPRHGQKHVVSLHPLPPGVDIRHSIRTSVPYVLRAVRVRVRHCQVELGFLRVGVRLEGAGFRPAPLPLLLDGFPVNHMHTIL